MVISRLMKDLESWDLESHNFYPQVIQDLINGYTLDFRSKVFPSDADKRLFSFNVQIE